MTQKVELKDRPARFKIGVALLVLCLLIYVVVTVVLFLPMDGGSKTALIAVAVVVAEACMLAGIACVGKEAVAAVKARFRRDKSAPAPGTVKSENAESAESPAAPQ
ncbi:transporter suffix domain-containing protein [Streptomyces sp. NPDC051546]|uniref:transporter suffix domain-containing protein n=1 Tax=Streptomyces sp. NPDC051546 TaxID=3365655 RepID=UPI00378A4497